MQMTDSSVHDIFEAEAADRDLPSPYMEKYFAKFEGSQLIHLSILRVIMRKIETWGQNIATKC